MLPPVLLSCASLILPVVTGMGISLIYPNSTNISLITKIYTEIVEGHLQPYKLITTIRSSEKLSNLLVERIKSTGLNIHSPNLLYSAGYYFELSERDRKDPAYGYNLNPYSTVQAFHCQANVDDFRALILPAMAFRNPLARVVLVSPGLGHSELVDIFHRAWFTHRIIDILILTRLDSHTMKCCLCNPFLTPPEELDDRNLLCRLLHSVNDAHDFLTEIDEFTHDRTWNLHRYPLKIALTDLNLMSKAIYNDNGAILQFQYLDGEMVETLRRKLNFTPHYLLLPYQESAGFTYANGSVGGTLALLETNAIDLAGNSRTMIPYRARNLQYAHYLNTIQMVFAVPSYYYAGLVHSYTFFNSFTWPYYGVNVGIALTLPLLLAMADWRFSFGKYTIRAMRVLGVVFAVAVIMPKGTRSRLALMGLLFYSIVSYPIWQAIAIHQLNKNTDKLAEIRTLRQLQTTHLKLQSSPAFGGLVRSAFANDSDDEQDVQETLLKGIVVEDIAYNATEMMLEIATKRKTAVLFIGSFSEVVRARYYDAKHKRDRVSIIPEPVAEYYTAMALPKNSPFHKQVNLLTTLCLETGIVTRELQAFKVNGILLQIQRIRNDSYLAMPTVRKFRLDTLQRVFHFYLGLHLCAILVFLGELWYHRRQQQRLGESSLGVRQDHTAAPRTPITGLPRRFLPISKRTYRQPYIE